MSRDVRPAPVIGDLTMHLPDGTTLSAGSDLALARQWAEQVHGPAVWDQLTPAQRTATVAEALAELRRAYAVGPLADGT